MPQKSGEFGTHWSWSAGARPVSASTLIEASSLLEDRRVRLVRQPLRLDRLEGPVALQRRERLVHAGGQLAVLGEHQPEMLRRADGRELADDRRGRDLHG